MIKFLQGNCLEKITELKDNSIDCVISSPPYYGLRDYGTAQWQGGNPNCSHAYGRNTRSGLTDFQKNNKGSFGDEAVKSGECCKLCGAKRIDEQFGLEKTYQDYIANTLKVFAAFRPKLKDQATIWWNVGDSYNTKPAGNKDLKKSSGLPNKKENLDKRKNNISKVLIKSLKPKDLLMIPNRVAIALQEDGWYIRSEIIWHKPNPMPESVTDRPTACHEKIWLITKNKKYYYDHEAIKEPCVSGFCKARMGGNKYGDHKDHPTKSGNIYKYTGKRNKRNVWTISPKPFREAHFATFPPDLIQPCVLAGCPQGGTVLDPFGGAGTTGLVAQQNKRHAILIELNPDYIAIAKKRLNENNDTIFAKKATSLRSSAIR